MRKYLRLFKLVDTTTVKLHVRHECTHNRTAYHQCSNLPAFSLLIIYRKRLHSSQSMLEILTRYRSLREIDEVSIL